MATRKGKSQKKKKKQNSNGIREFKNSNASDWLGDILTGLSVGFLVLVLYMLSHPLAKVSCDDLACDHMRLSGKWTGTFYFHSSLRLFSEGAFIHSYKALGCALSSLYLSGKL